MQKSSSVESSYTQVSPDFNSDSAFLYVKTQVDFGPRVPNSAAHVACGDYLVSKLNEFGAEVTEQKMVLKTYDGIALNARNIIGAYNPESKKRVLLFAHWDTRPFADEDTDIKKRTQPILGANDGGSGVGVLLEIARQLDKLPVDIGVDIIFFDAEDWGQPSYESRHISGDWWCLGSQYWAENPHVSNYRAKFGILLDMVGASNATFYKEGYSVQYASNITEKIWQIGSRLGYGNYFINKRGGYITDDHVPVNQLHRAPSVNIIHTSEETPHGFGDFWHTHNDNMSVVNKSTLKAVGQTVMEVVYSEE
ncbi:MAG TPA: M28 family peptidase [Dysgonamonadaceae bacterium]|nr:M28 family peptidase [Dysgonamonadaceae bacterium]